MQWTTVIESARAEAATVAPERYAEIRYEDMVREPRAVIESVIDFVGLAPSTRASEYLAQRVTLRDMNVRWREAFGAERLERITDLMTPTLARLGYDHGGDPSPVDQPLRRPLVKKLS